MMKQDKMVKRQDSGDLQPREQHERLYNPRVDVLENSEEYLVVADLPGVTQNNLQIDVEKDLLTIEGQMLDTQESWIPAALEVHRGTYRREFRLPRGLEVDKIKAEFNHGVLSVHLPKGAKLKPRKIAISID